MKNLVFVFVLFCLAILIACNQPTPPQQSQNQKIESDSLWGIREKRYKKRAQNTNEMLLKEEKVVFYYSEQKNTSDKINQGETYAVKRVNGKIYNYCLDEGGTPLPGSEVVLVWKKGDPDFRITYSAW